MVAPKAALATSSQVNSVSVAAEMMPVMVSVARKSMIHSWAMSTASDRAPLLMNEAYCDSPAPTWGRVHCWSLTSRYIRLKPRYSVARPR